MYKVVTSVMGAAQAEELEAATGVCLFVCFASLLFFMGVWPLWRSRTRFSEPVGRSPAPVEEEDAAPGVSGESVEVVVRARFSPPTAVTEESRIPATEAAEVTEDLEKSLSASRNRRRLPPPAPGLAPEVLLRPSDLTFDKKLSHPRIMFP
jgi:hypothetical protein